MKVFLSWSGDFSKEIAGLLSSWIPSVLQSVEVFYSPDDIAKGENWNSKISTELASCNYGIVCLTAENVTAPWIHFEAGALSKSLNSKLSSLLVGVSNSDVKGPLSRFQNTMFSKDEMYQLVQSLNTSIEKPLQLDVLKYTFDAMWPRLESEILSATNKYSSKQVGKPKEKPINEAVEEILRIVRKLNDNKEKVIYNISNIPTDPNNLVIDPETA